MSWLCFGSRLLLLVTGPEGVIKLYEVDCKMAAKMSHLSTFLLPHSKQRWVTDAIVVGDDDDGEKISSGNSTDISLVCGDRRGSLHLFNTCSQVIPSWLMNNNGTRFSRNSRILSRKICLK